jgi:hypothetical protein
MATNDERNAAHILTLLEQAPGRQLSSAQLAEQTGWSPEELNAAVGLLSGRQQVVLIDVNVGGPCGEGCSPPTKRMGVGAAIVVGARESRAQGEGRQGSDVRQRIVGDHLGNPWWSWDIPVASMKGEPMTDESREVATPWRAGCLERGTSGSEGGVGKHSSAVRPAPTLLVESMGVWGAEEACE